MPYIFKNATGSAGGSMALLVPLLLLAILCGTGCCTVASRVIWAFARDGAIPGARHWTRISPTLHIPLNAMILSTVIQVLLGLIYFGSTAAFNAFSGVGVICLTASYAVPITVSLFRGRKQVKQGRFYFGFFGAVCNVIAIALPLFCMPTSIPVTATTVNYRPVVFVASALLSAFWYWCWGHKNYAGPPTGHIE